MVDAGLPLVQCLDLLVREEPDRRLREAIAHVRMNIERGASLAEAMRRRPDVFDALYTSMVAAGEAGGVLDVVLERLAVLLEQRARLVSQVRSAAAYPVAVLIVAALVVMAILWKVVPTFTALFEGLGATLPAPTVALIWMSRTLCGVLPGRACRHCPRRLAVSAVLRDAGRTNSSRSTHPARADARRPHAPGGGGSILPDVVDAAVVGRSDSGWARHHGRDCGQRRRGVGREAGPAADRTGRDPCAAASRERSVSADGRPVDWRRRAHGRPRRHAGPDRASFTKTRSTRRVRRLLAVMEPALISALGLVVGGIVVSMSLPLFELIGQLS